jgi:hypothetical protein
VVVPAFALVDVAGDAEEKECGEQRVVENADGPDQKREDEESKGEWVVGPREPAEDELAEREVSVAAMVGREVAKQIEEGGAF